MDPCPVLVGRQQELAALRAILDAGGGVAMVSGEAGIGKSRLVREFANEAVGRGRIDLWARPEEVAQPGPYALIVDLLESTAERSKGALKNEARALISELTRQDSDGQRPAPSPRTVAAEIRGLVSQLGGSPFVVMEDLQWADEQSHSVILHLMRAARDDQHVIVATMRPERGKSEESLAKLQDTISRERIAVDVALDPLAQAEMAEMLELIWGREPTEAELADFERLGEGIPFFIEELASSAAESGRPQLPRSIEQSVAARLSELGEEAGNVLRAASLTSGPLDVAVLALASDMPESRITNHLISASRSGLLVDLEGRLAFRHSLAREAIRAGLVSVEAAQLHGRLATAIEKVHSGELDTFASALAHHYSVAGERHSAVEYSIRSGHRALAFAATEEARSAFKSALRLDPDSTYALRGLAEVEFRDGNEPEASTLFRRVADSFAEAGDSVEAARVLGRLAWSLQGQVQPWKVIAVLDEALALVTEEENPQERARLMVQKGSIQCFLLNETTEARPTLDQALRVAEQAGDASLIAEALDGLAQVEELEGRLDRAVALGAQAIDSATQSGAAEVVGRTHNNFALKLAISGKPIEALGVLEKGRDYLRREHGQAALGALDVSEAWVFWLMGVPNEVAQLTARGRVAWQRWRGYRWVLDTWSAVERGDRTRAASAVDEAWRALGVQQERLTESLASWTRDTGAAVFAHILFALSEGRADEVIQEAEALVQYGKEGVERFDFGQMLALKARTTTMAKRLDEAGSTIDALWELLRVHRHPYLEGLAHEAVAAVALEREHFEDAISSLRMSIARLEVCENQGDLARCERLLAEAIARRDGGDDSEIRTRLKRARALADSTGSNVELNRIEAMARGLGLRLRSGRSKKSDDNALSPRELEVAALVAEGETNAGIAARLFLSDRTVQDHITHALRKLQLSSRAALASWAARNGLL